MIYPGKFIVVDGVDGCGKTTAAKELARLIRETGRTVIETREPGGCPSSEKLREILKFGDLVPMAELLTILAARVQHLEQVIIPALKDGHAVVCDRYDISTYAYQGYGRELGLSPIFKLENAIYEYNRHFPVPDTYLYLKVPLEVAEARRVSRRAETEPTDNFEAEEAFRRRVYTGYLHLLEAGNWPFSNRVLTIDADRTPQAIAETLAIWVKEKLVG